MKRFIGLITLIFATIAPLPAQELASDTLQLGEVTVTALKQGANLDRQPVSATVIHRADAERNDITGVKTAAALVPNLHIPDYGSRMTSTIYIRGIGTRIDQPAVGLNIDNIPVLTKENYDFDLLDIRRVEVLRGPQSALFGRNTMGGVMNLYTLSPLSYQGTRLLGQASLPGAYRLGASHYARISHRLGLAVAAGYGGRRGVDINRFNNRRVGTERQLSTRARLEWRPNSRWMLSNSLSLGVTRQSGYPYEYQPTGEINYNDTCFYRRTSILEGLTVEHRRERLSVTSITSYQYINDNMTLDQDFMPQPYFTLTQARREHAVTEEVIVRGTTAGAWQWSAGAFGFYRRMSMDAPVTFKDTGIRTLIEEHVNAATPNYPIVWDTRQFVLGSSFTMPSFGTAAYARAGYRWRKFNIEAALRLDYEHARLNYRSTTHTGYTTYRLPGNTVFSHENVDIDDSGTLNRDFFELLPRLAVTYQLTLLNSLYATIARGSKAGGFNTQMFSDVLQQRLMGTMGIGAQYDVGRIVSYKPEHGWNYEVGAHLSLDNRRLGASIAAFLFDCRNRQLTVFPDGTTTGRVMTNAGHTRNTGVEIALNAIPWTRGTITASYGFVDARFVEYNDNRADYRHRIIPYAPRHTLFGQVMQQFNVSRYPSVKYFLEANVRAAGPIYWNESNTAVQPFYAVVGASASVETPRFALQIWVRNITSTEYSTFYFVSMNRAFLQRNSDGGIGATVRINL